MPISPDITVLVQTPGGVPLGLLTLPNHMRLEPKLKVTVRTGTVELPWRFIMPHYGVAIAKAVDRDRLKNAWVLRPYVRQPWETS